MEVHKQSRYGSWKLNFVRKWKLSKNGFWGESKIERQNEYETVTKVGGLLGKRRLWCGPFEEAVVDVLLDSWTLQKFEKKHLCCVLDGMPKDLSRCSQIFWEERFSLYRQKKFFISIVELIFKIFFFAWRYCFSLFQDFVLCVERISDPPLTEYRTYPFKYLNWGLFQSLKL